jgi:glutathione synthase
MKLAFVLDPLDSIKIYKDSSYAMMEEAARRGHELAVLHQEHILFREGRVLGRAAPITLTGDKHAWYKLGEETELPLSAFDAVLMRKDPPFDMEYVYSTYLPELTRNAGRIVNRRAACALQREVLRHPVHPAHRAHARDPAGKRDPRFPRHPR